MGDNRTLVELRAEAVSIKQDIAALTDRLARLPIWLVEELADWMDEQGDKLNPKPKANPPGAESK